MNSQSNRKDRNEDYLPEPLNEHSGAEEEACRGDKKACSAILSIVSRPLRSEIDGIEKAEFHLSEGIS